MSSTRSQLAMAALLSLSSALPQGYPLRPTGSGHPYYPTGNSTGIWGTGTGTGFPTGSSFLPPTSLASDVVTRTTTFTNVVGETITRTVTDVVSASDAADTCASEVTSTVTKKVTVTVSAGGEAQSSAAVVQSSPAVAQSSAAVVQSSVAVDSTLAAGAQSSVAFVLPGSSTIVVPVVTSTQTAGISSHRHGYGHSRFHSSAAPVASSPVSSVAAAAVSTPVVYSSSSSAAAASTPVSSPAPVESSAAAVVTSTPAAVTSTPVAATSTPAAVESSAAPATSGSAATCSGARPSAPAVGTSGKRGAAYNTASLCDAFSGSSQVTWAYNWASSPDGDLPSNMEYIPMMWGMTDWATSGFNQSIKDGDYTTILGFNEPDMYLSTDPNNKQADMTPQQAADAWPWMEQFACQARLGSPAVTNGDNGMGLSYLEEFFPLCKDCTIDFVVLHWYGLCDGLDDLRNHIEEAVTKFGKPIWLTEFEPNDGDDAQKAAFLKSAMEYLDGNKNVERYAYYGVFDGLLVDGTAASSLGDVYAA